MTAFDNQTSLPCGRGAAHEQTQTAGAAEGAERPGYAAVRALLDTLVAAFPACFKPHATPGLPPIKAGIDADILARRPDIDPNLLQAALRVYASGPEYWRGLIAGRPRVDIDGQIVQAVITPEEKAEAERRLAIFDVNQEARKKSFREIATLLDKLAADFPACFKGKGAGDPHPLKIGIHADILARIPDIDPALLHAALRLYVRAPAYQRSVIAGRPRVDIDGQVVQAAITPRETAHAQDVLSASDAKAAARRASAAKLLGELVATFPACFKPEGARDPAPLTSGVDADLRARLPNVAPSLLSYVLDRYRARLEYCRAVVAGRAPVDLDGRPVEFPSTPEDIAKARDRLAALERRTGARGGRMDRAAKARPAPTPRAEKETAAPGRATWSPHENDRGPGGRPEQAVAAVKVAPPRAAQAPTPPPPWRLGPRPKLLRPQKAKPRQPEASHAPSAPEPLPEAPPPAPAPTPDPPAAPPPQERERYPLSKRQQTLMGTFTGAPASAPRSGKRR